MVSRPGMRIRLLLLFLAVAPLVLAGCGSKY
jgi:hypothetical protein